MLFDIKGSEKGIKNVCDKVPHNSPAGRRAADNMANKLDPAPS